MDETMIKTELRPELRGSYDPNADVLHLAVGEPAAVEGTGFAGGIELDYDIKSGMPCAVLVFGYFRNGWPEKTEALSKIISEHLAVSGEGLSATIRGIIGK